MIPTQTPAKRSSAMPSHILVVEDEPDLRRVMTYNFKQAGFDVVSAPDGETALRAVKEERFDLVLLDLMLPDMPGTEVCRRLKQGAQTSTIPVVMVTAKGEEIDRIVGFELGADDYVVKPFSVRELLLRVQAVLRRTVTSDAPVLEFKDLRVDRVAHRVWVRGEELQLTTLEFKLLVTLLDRRNRVQSRGVLLSDVWGLDSEIASRTVDTHVKRLREKLGGAGYYIETVRGVGYRVSDAPFEAH
jgi:two-component system phosphate regulon response regulator PhoB